MTAEDSDHPDVASGIPEDLYRQVIGSLPAVIYVFGRAEQRFLYVSPQCEAVLGVPLGEMMVDGPERVRIFHPDDRGRILQSMAELEDTGSWDIEYRLLRRDGSTLWVHDRARSVPATDERSAAWCGVITPIDRAETVDRALADAEARYESLVEQLPAVVYIDTHEETPITIYVSRQIERVTGYLPEEWIQDPELWLRVVHPEDRGIMRCDWPLHLEGEEEAANEYRVVHRDGHVLWVRDVARLVHAADGTPLFWQGVMLDVTEQHRIEEERLRSEARYRALVEQVPGIVYIDTNEPDPVPMYVSPQVLELTGYSVEDWMADRGLWLKAIHPDDRERVRGEWHSAVGRRGPFSVEYRSVHRDGRVSWFHDTARLVGSHDGKPLFWQGLIQDVTEAKRAEDGLRASEARYRMLVERVPAVVYEMDPDDERRTLFVSPQVEALFGYSRAEWLEQPDIWIELLHPDDREIQLAAHDLHNETGEPWSQEYRLIASDGRVVWVRDQARLVRDGSGNASTWQGIMLDITRQKDLEERLRRSNDDLEFRVLQRTAELEEANEMLTLEIGERKRIESELRETRERYRRLVEDLPAVVYRWQVGHAAGAPLHYTSPRIERLLGYSAEEWNASELWIDRLHPHDRERVLDAAARSETTGEPFSEEYRLFAKDGRLVVVFDHATLLSRDERGRPLLFQGVLMDMTERHRAEELAARTAERYRELAEDGPVVFSVLEIDPHRERRFKLRYISPQIQDILGYPPARFYADVWNWLDIVHPDDRAKAEGTSERLIAGNPWNIDYRMIADDGRVVWMHLEGRTTERDDEGRPRRLQGIMMDVTDRREAERRANDEATQLRSLVEQLPGVAWTCLVEDPSDWLPVFIAPQVEQLLGYTSAELMAEPRSFVRLIHPEDRARSLELAARCVRRSEPWRADYRIVARDGRVVWLHSRGNPGRDAMGRPVIHGMWFDITAERERESVAPRGLIEQRER